jgi:hypothetical protein
MFDWPATILSGEAAAIHDTASSHGPVILAVDQLADPNHQPPGGGHLILQCTASADGGLHISLPSGTTNWPDGLFPITDHLFCVHPVSPLNQIDSRPLFTLRGVNSFFAQRIYLHSFTAVFAVVQESERKAVLVLGGRPGDQALDDMYVCARIGKAAYIDSAVTIPRFDAGHSLVGWSTLGVVIATEGARQCHVFEIGPDADPCAPLLSHVVPLPPPPPSAQGAKLTISSPPNVDVGRGFILSEGGKSKGAVMWAQNPHAPTHEPSEKSLQPDYTWLAKLGLRSEADFKPPSDFTSAGEVRARTLGFEVDGSLFLLVRNARDVGNRFYSPAPRNVVLRANIVSLYNRFYRHAPDELPQVDESRLLLAVIDIGSLDSTRRAFLAGTAPGLYARYVREDPQTQTVEEFPDNPDPQTAPEMFRYAGEDGDVRTFPTWWLYFNNGSLPVGLAYHRTLCQLFAAFCCAAVIRVHGPGMMVRDFRLSSPLFDRQSFLDARARLIATYGTLLRIGSKHFTYAARLLPTTHHNIKSFKNFLRQLDSDWSDANAGEILTENDIDARLNRAKPI